MGDLLDWGFTEIDLGLYPEDEEKSSTDEPSYEKPKMIICPNCGAIINQNNGE
jgi:hypothetical protein